MGKTPVTPVVSGKPVTLVSTPEAGVPSAGVVKMGEVSVLFVSVCVSVRPTGALPPVVVTPEGNAPAARAAGWTTAVHPVASQFVPVLTNKQLVAEGIVIVVSWVGPLMM
jgi:hypothetical protein